jgi:hypothetical protein
VRRKPKGEHHGYEKAQEAGQGQQEDRVIASYNAEKPGPWPGFFVSAGRQRLTARGLRLQFAWMFADLMICAGIAPVSAANTTAQSASVLLIVMVSSPCRPLAGQMRDWGHQIQLDGNDRIEPDLSPRSCGVDAGLRVLMKID